MYCTGNPQRFFFYGTLRTRPNLEWFLENRSVKQKIRRHVTPEAMNQLVAAVILGRLDYCNSVLAGLPWSTVAPLQRGRDALRHSGLVVVERLLTTGGRQALSCSSPVYQESQLQRIYGGTAAGTQCLRLSEHCFIFVCVYDKLLPICCFIYLLSFT